MGNWFSNLHVRKNEAITETAIIDCIRNLMDSQRYLPASSEEEADATFAILSRDDSQWYSVYSDILSFELPKSFVNYAAPMSKELETDILGLSCFDSDYLYLNLINAADNLDAWAAIGSAAGLGISRRTNLSAWKQKVEDFPKFKGSIQRKYVFAEEALAEIEHCLRLPYTHGMSSYEQLTELGLSKAATFLYFKLPEALKTQDAPKLVSYSYSLSPWRLEQPSIVSALNTGGASKGLSVYFIGPYVEHDEITFSDVCFVKSNNNQPTSLPFELTKTQLPNGQWAYYYHDPNFQIPSKVDESLPTRKRLRMESDQHITVRFVPHGNPRKILDITVALVPDKNPQGQTGWNVWHKFGSKKAYIAFNNNNWSKYPNCEHMLLREEDFD